MKQAIIIALCCILATGARVPGEEVNATCEARNPSTRARIDAPVVIDLHAITLGINPRSAVVTDETGNEIPSQLDDLDGDGYADELACVIDIPAGATRRLHLTFSPRPPTKTYPSRVHAQMLVSDKKGKHVPVHSITIPGTSDIYNQLHHHGPALESELVAYRLYFDRKQTIDIYGKFNKGLEIAACGFYPTDEQLASGFGDDVLRVGNSCGVGTLKGWDGTRATHVEPVVTRSERVVAAGPARAIVEASVHGWTRGEVSLDVTTRYTLYAGHRDLLVEVFFSEPPGEQLFCTGVQDIRGSRSFSDHAGLVACWGTDWPVNDTVKYAKETVGLAVSIPSRHVRAEARDPLNYLYVIAAPNERYIHYHATFTSMKESFGFKTPDDWFDHVRAWKTDLETPLEVQTSVAPRTRATSPPAT